MPAFNQIEIYLSLTNVDDEAFISRVSKLLALSTLDKTQRKEFLTSIKMIDEEGDRYFEYNKINLNFNNQQIENHLSWNLDLFYWQKQNLKYEIRLAIISDTILINSYPKMHYNKNLMLPIENLMMEIYNQEGIELVLFTDESNEGEFVIELDYSRNDNMYLFDLAYITDNIKWKMNLGKYEIVEKLKNGTKYMRKNFYQQLQ